MHAGVGKGWIDVGRSRQATAVDLGLGLGTARGTEQEGTYQRLSAFADTVHLKRSGTKLIHFWMSGENKTSGC